MGFFDKFKTKETTSVTRHIQDVQDVQMPASTISLEKKISLRKEILVDEVKKQNISSTKARVVFVLDHSGSMESKYRDGSIQTLLERVFPMAMCFDDNSELEFYLFDTNYKELKTVTNTNLGTYVKDEIIKKHYDYGGTKYAPVINTIVKRYGVEDPAVIPTFVIFITDGDNWDKPKSEQAIIEASKYNIFWKFIGIGDADFMFLKNLDTMENRYVDNANFVAINNIDNTGDKDLYAKLLEEYNDWLSSCRMKGILV